MRKEVEKFLDFFDRYVIAELETMVDIIDEKEKGGLGFQALHTIVAGMELLGLILFEKRGEEAFREFWFKCFIKSHPKYQNLEDVFYTVIRCGTGHFAVAKAGVVVQKKGRDHLTRIADDNLIIDLKVFRDDLVTCYEGLKTKIESNENLIKGIDTFDEQMREAQRIVMEYISKVGPDLASTINDGLPPSGVSLLRDKWDP